ncbi:uncharacterized protein KY384_004251 [Bacidia gigantensis]|uniref:uncharacterized protein n=1 Tax=Bacidia gigantensis TaxID=2732470 RepID=UPI001D04B9A2|nr:uncharacterized protein KY384_004251 [Bacidia gigantensis]KAG8530894.1 hypothetical protein KY384_004251 [Bacidia gigantensis]
MQEKKILYRDKRDAFAADNGALVELDHWKKKDPTYRYSKLKGLISDERLADQTTEASLKPFTRGDSYFSEFALHNKQEFILSESDYSYIVGNLASYDKRQYPAWLDPKYSKCTPEGQGFGHCLVIPKKRIHNIVDPEAVANKCAIINELRNHFTGFWGTQNGRKKLLDRTFSIFDGQNAILRTKDSLQAKKLVADVISTYNLLAPQFKQLQAEDFMCAFHPAPDISVGHLHLHVFPKAELFREFSAMRHEWKTIPFDAVTQVESEHPLALDQLPKG